MKTMRRMGCVGVVGLAGMLGFTGTAWGDNGTATNAAMTVDGGAGGETVTPNGAGGPTGGGGVTAIVGSGGAGNGGASAAGVGVQANGGGASAAVGPVGGDAVGNASAAPPGAALLAAGAGTGRGRARVGETPIATGDDGRGGAGGGSHVVRGSLFRQTSNPLAAAGPGEPDPPISGSYFGVAPASPRKYKKNDLVTIVINENSDSSSTGTGNSTKKTNFDFAVQQMAQANLASSGLPVITKVGSPSSLPEIQTKWDSERTNDASQQRTDTFTARLTAVVVDVKPNGNLVIEATKRITVDREVQIFRMSGVCRAADVLPDNTVLSTQLADLTLGKFTEGEVRDGTKAGWLGRMIDKVGPF